MVHPLANALIVVDVELNSPDDEVKKIYQYLIEHEDEYKVVLATKSSATAVFHPVLRAYPDAREPYSAENTDFDSVFLPNQFGWYNPNGEDMHTYLRRHGIGHIDFAGDTTKTTPLATIAVDFGYSVAILVSNSEVLLPMKFKP